MKCSTCGRSTEVIETKEVGLPVAQRRRKCTAGHYTQTYEITRSMWLNAQYDIRRVINAQVYNHMIQGRRELAKVLNEERDKGKTCVELAADHGMSVHMVRYYTRRPLPAKGIKNQKVVRK